MNREVHSFPELMKRQAGAAMAVGGAEHSDWNGTVRTPRQRADRGVAEWDGSLTYSYEQIKRPLREMFRNAGGQHDEATLLEYRNALKTVLHENAHLLVPRGADRSGAEREFDSLAGQALEEGVTEAWAYDNLNEYIDELGLEKVAPGIRGVSGRPVVYARYAPAARELAARLAERLDVPETDMLARLNREDAAGKWDLVTDTMFERSKLLVPEPEQAAVKERIRSVMQQRLESVKDLTGRNADGEQGARFLVVQSAIVGQDTYRAGAELVERLERERTPGVEAAKAPERQVGAQAHTAWVATAGTAAPQAARPDTPATPRPSGPPARRQTELDR